VLHQPDDDQMTSLSRTIRLRVAYDGTRYSGWQIQPGRTTVQGTLAEAIHRVSGEEILPQGASRTDAGVHALDQVVAFTTQSLHEPAVWVRALNAWLPHDIKALSLPYSRRCPEARALPAPRLEMVGRAGRRDHARRGTGARRRA